MKAWFVRDEGRDDVATVVFAETRGEAHSLAMRTDAFENARWVDVSVRRAPMFDDESRKQSEMDWYDPDDRVALVRYANFTCSYEMDYADCPCDTCPATQYCGRYESMHEEDGDA